MSDTFKIMEAYIEITTRDQAAQRSIDALKGKVTQLEKRLSGVNKPLDNLQKTLTRAFGAAAIAKFAADTVRATALQERSLNNVKAALATTGQEVDNNAEGIHAWAKSMQDATGISATATQNAVAYSISLGASAEQAKALAQAGAGLADRFGGDVQLATKAVTKASQGYWEQMHENFPMLRQFTTAQEKMAAVQKLAAAGVERQKATNNDLQGSLKQVSLALTDLQAGWGGLASGPLNDATNALADFIRMSTPGTDQQKGLFNFYREEFFSLAESIYEAAASVASFFQMDDVAADFTKKAEDMQKAIDGIKEAEAKRTNELIKKDAANQKSTNITTQAIKGQKKELEGKFVGGMEEYLKLVQKEMFDTQKVAAQTGKAINQAATGGGGGGGGTTPPPPSGGVAGGASGGAAGGGAGYGGKSELHDREWHRKRLKQRQNQLGSAFDSDNRWDTERSAGMGKKVQKWQADAQESLDIATHGTKAEADRQRAESRDYKATQDRIRRQKEEIMSHGRPDKATYDSAGPIGQKEFDEREKFNKEQAARMADAENKAFEERSGKRKKAYDPKIEAEKKRLNTPIDVDATGARGALQEKLGQPQSGKPILVESKESEKLLSVLQKLDVALPKLAKRSTFR